MLIIGGGLAGILCAYRLAQTGIDYILIEADTVANGVTRNTTAKITSQHGLIYNKLLKRFDEDEIERIRRRAEDHFRASG